MSHDETPIPAATVLLLRDKPAFEVLMVERHADIGFAGGALVFPGGRIDPGDANPAWADHADGLDAVTAPAQVAAIREAFEETGVLIARDAAGEILSGERASALHSWRKKVEADDTLFLELVRTEKLKLACDRLVLFAHWVAPPGLHRRFDTLFFAARTPEGQQVSADGSEATEVLWTTPEDVIAAREAGTRKLIFPTIRNVELLGVSRSCKEAFESAKKRKIAPIQPEAEKRDGVLWLTIPDDCGYPVTEELLETATRV